MGECHYNGCNLLPSECGANQTIKERTVELTSVRSVVVLIAVLLLCVSGAGAQSSKVVFATNLAGWPEMVKAVEVFESLHPDIDVELVAIGSNVGEDLLTLYAAGHAPDAYTFLHSILPGFLGNNMVARLDEFFERDPNVSVRDYVGLDMGPEGIWALPLTVNAWFTVYNQTLFSEMGLAYPRVGWTPEEFRDTISRLTQDFDGDGTPDQWGYAGYQSMRDLNATESWLRPFGANVFGPDGSPTANSPAMREAFNFWRSVVESGNNLVPNYNANDDWISGRVGMSLADRVHLVAQSQLLQFDFALTPLPFREGVAPSSVGTGHYFAISSQASDPEAAWRWITWITGPEGHKVLEERGLLPGHIGAFDIYAGYWEARASSANLPKNLNVITETTAYIEPPSVVNSGMNLAEVSPIYQRYLDEAIINGTMPPEQALDEMQRQLQALRGN